MCGADAQGAGILLAGASAEALQAASLAIKQALPPICSGCLLVLQARHPAGLGLGIMWGWPSGRRCRPSAVAASLFSRRATLPVAIRGPCLCSPLAICHAITELL